jgi:hypothetical protein
VRFLLGLNATLAFLLELALLAAAVAVGLLLPAPTAVRIVIAVLLPVLVIATWAVVMAPRAGRRLDPPKRALVQTVLFAAAVAAPSARSGGPWRSRCSSRCGSASAHDSAGSDQPSGDASTMRRIGRASGSASSSPSDPVNTSAVPAGTSKRMGLPFVRCQEDGCPRSTRDG